MSTSPQNETLTYQPLLAGSPIGGWFFFVIGSIGVGFEFALFVLDIGTLSDITPLGEMIFLLYSFVFMLMGASILFYKKRYVFDRKKRTLTPIVQLPFLTLQKKTLSYEYIDAVQISRKVVGSGKNVSVIFTVSLAADDAPDVPLEVLFRYQNAKRVGEILSLGLMRPLHDISSGRIVVKQASEFKSNLQEKLLQNKDIRDEPLKPKDMDSFLSETIGRLQIHIPPFGILDSLFTLLIPSFLLFLFFSWLSYALLQKLPFEIIVYSLSVPVVFIVVAGSFLFRSEHIAIDNHDLVLSWSFFGFRGRKKIPLQQLEGLFVMGKEDTDDKLQFLKALTKTETYGREKDLFYPFRCLSSSIIARAGKQTIHFGRSLDIEELVYLVYLIETFMKDGTLRTK